MTQVLRYYIFFVLVYVAEAWSLTDAHLSILNFFDHSQNTAVLLQMLKVLLKAIEDLVLGEHHG